ncbi:hypothetical protein AGLY_007855 [Aphis glycines]|uniref:Uncharacterized protein n=1 Tax=Aphis glycines TaxID=307491 RepID=A0A6G0TP33_APHGL|nr:hypothetical protein AGLY_007855 [Aphis glycines]
MDIFYFCSCFHRLRDVKIHFVPIKISIIRRSTTIKNKSNNFRKCHILSNSTRYTDFINSQIWIRVRAEKSTRFPIKFPRILPSLPFNRDFIAFRDPNITIAGRTGKGGTGKTVNTIQSGRANLGSIPMITTSSSVICFKISCTRSAVKGSISPPSFGRPPSIVSAKRMPPSVTDILCVRTAEYEI